MTATQIAHKLSTKHWHYLKQICLPNSFFAGAEADLLVLYPSGWLEEVEIKISISDFRREFKTKAWKHGSLQGIYSHKDGQILRRFWFACPSELAPKLLPEIPEYAGLISVDNQLAIVKQAPTLKGCRKLTDAEQKKLLRLTHVRFWDRELKSLTEAS
jgi:hypothetical protein